MNSTQNYQQDQLPTKRLKIGNKNTFNNGIKVISTSVDKHKSSNQSIPTSNHISIQRQGQNPVKISNKGISVTSSRQSSTQRHNSNSRSGDKGKAGKQVHSQQYISQFQTFHETQMSNVSKDTFREIERNHIITGFVEKMKMQVQRINAQHQETVQRLKDIIDQNQLRIDQMTQNYNQVAYKNQKNLKIISKLQSRLSTIDKYEQQCFEFTNGRSNDLQKRLNIIIQVINKRQEDLEYTEQRLIDVYRTIKLIFVKCKFPQPTNFQVDTVQIDRINSSISNIQIKLRQLDNKLPVSGSGSNNDYADIKKTFYKHLNLYNQIKESMNQQDKQYANLFRQTRALQQKLEIAFKQIKTIKSEFQKKEKNSQQSIWELSNMLNTTSRQYERQVTRNDELSQYNKQIQTKLQQASHNSQMMNSQIQNKVGQFFEELQRCKGERDQVREKYQQLLSHCQYLQNINSRNKVELMSLSEANDCLKRQYSDLQQTQIEREKVIDFFKGNQSQMQQNIAQMASFHEKIRTIHQAHKQFQYIYDQQVIKVSKLQAQISAMILKYKEAQDRILSLTAEYDAVIRQYDEQCEYSVHLEQQNEKLTNSIESYKQIFTNQSQVFKSTIQKLRTQNYQLKKSNYMLSSRLLSLPQEINKTQVN